MADEGFKRKLTAILSADVEGYSRLMGEDEEATVRTLTAYREVLTTLIQQHNGNVLDSPGDNLLAEFVSVVDAVQCAVAVQKEIKARNDELTENRRMQFRIGINLGDVIQEKDRLYGDGVNIAARLEGLAEPGGICISKTAFDHIESKLPYGYDFIGDQTVKNIARPIGAYRVLMEPRVTISGKPVDKKPTDKRRMPILVGAVAVLVLALAVGVWQFYTHRPKVGSASEDKMAYPLPEKPSIAVLPFVNLSGDPEQEYFADAISENITTELSRFDHLFVIARQSAFVYKRSKKTSKQISQELGVRYLLEGSVQRSDNQVRIIAQLIDAVSGKHVWTEKFDRNLSNIFAIQDEITLTVVNTLSEKIWQISAKALGKKPLSNFKAWDYVLKGRAHYRRHNKQENATARTLFEKALELDPDLSLAYIWLAWTHYMDWRFWGSDFEAIDKVEVLTNKAALLGENRADIQYLLSRIALARKRYDAALAHMERALTLKPNDAEFIYNYGTLLMYAGRSEESIPWLKKAMRINPYHPDGWVYLLAGSYYLTQRYGEVVDTIVGSARSHIGDHVLLAASYAKMGLIDKAQAHVKEILKINPEFKLSKFQTYLQRLYKNETDIEHYIDGLRKAGLPEHPPFKLPDKPSIAVLPFDNMSGDPEQDYLCDGIADQIINSIAKIPYILVIARNSSFAYKGKAVNVQQIAKELGVRYIVEGSLQRARENVRINIQLIDAKTGGHLWAENYDRKLDDIFSVQDEICKSIMVALQMKLTAGEIARMEADTVSIKAYEKFLKATEHNARRTKEDVLIARRLAQEAIALDPEYAAAYLLVGWTYLDEIWFRMTKSPSESIARAEEMAEKTISLHGITATANTLRGSINILKKDFDKAIYYGEKAIKQNPNIAAAHNMLGTALRLNGQYDEAISSFKKALQLNPIKAITIQNGLAWAYLYSKQYENAISIWNETLERNPDYLFAYMGLTLAYSWNGSDDQARQAAKNVLRVDPKFSVGYWEKRSHLKDKVLEERMFDTWRKAGLK
jgi:adenylate cyclase